MSKRFAIYEVERNEKLSISVHFDEIYFYLDCIGEVGVVSVKRTQNHGDLQKCHVENGNIYEISSKICDEFIIDGCLKTETFELNNTKFKIPQNLRKISCKKFSAAFLGGQRAKEWLALVDGPIETLRITEIEKIYGLGNMDQFKNVNEELIIAGSDITDEHIIGLQDCRTLVLNPSNATDKGVKKKLKKWLELETMSGNVFEIRFTLSSPEFDKNQFFKEWRVKWTQYYQFKLKHTRTSGKNVEFNGYYFIANGSHLIKLWNK